MLADIYNDFFNTALDATTQSTSLSIQDKEEIDFGAIDNLFLTDLSKDLLKKIILYMQRYYNKVEENYITFNIVLSFDDKSMVEEVKNLLENYARLYNYVDSATSAVVSMYQLDNVNSLIDYYNNNGIIMFKNLDAIAMNDVNFQKRFLYNLKEKLNGKKMTILVGEKLEISKFLQSDSELESYFNFKLYCSSPTSNDVYQVILKKTDNMNLDDDFKIKLLDYIVATYSNSDLDYTTYLENLYDYISFNKKVPELEKVKSVDEIFKDLNDLVGLEKVKRTLYDLVDLITLKNKTKDDLKISDVNLHMVFLGNPGTGKTTVARMIAEILFQLKYIRQNKLIEVSSKDLIAGYTGQTALKTMDVIDRARGGVLFVDEAYSLAINNDDNSFNGECIATLIKAMEDYRDDLVVIFAGYTKEMQKFLDSNSGIMSRIGYVFEFEDYTNEELKKIFQGMVAKAGFILEDDALIEVDKLISANRNTKNFGNARFVRNVFEKTVIRHASNTKDCKNKKILKTISKNDISYGE